MDLIVYLNDSFVKANEAKISIYDHGFLYGEGVFETLRAYKGHVFKFQNHIQRMYHSLRQISMDLPSSPHIILKTIKLLLHHNQLTDARIRLTVTRGEGPIGLDYSLCPRPTVLMLAEPIGRYPTSWYLQGIAAVIVTQRRVPAACISPTIKSANYLVNILAKKEALDKGAQEGIMLNMEGYLTEGTTSNVFLVRGKTLFTPALSSGILGGITRETVIELAERRHLEVIQTHLLPRDILASDEAFLTNTTMEIMPLCYCDGTKIGHGQPGKITRLLMKDYKRLVEKAIQEEKEVNV